MKILKITIAAVVLAVGGASAADAQRWDHGRGYHHGYHGHHYRGYHPPYWHHRVYNRHGRHWH